MYTDDFSNNETIRTNRTAVLAHTLTAVGSLICYIIPLMDKDYSVPYFLILACLAMLPVIAEIFFYIRNPRTGFVKHSVAIGFACFYSFALFTCKDPLTFSLIFPLMVIVAIFSDIAYIVKIVSGVIIETIAVVIIGSSKGTLGFIDIKTSIIQIVSVVLTMLFCILATAVLQKNTNARMQSILDSKRDSENALNTVSTMTENLKTSITSIYEELEQLKGAASLTNATMEEVSLGAADTASAVQTQILQTEAIQNKVNDVDAAAEHIAGNLSHTLSIIDASNEQIKYLVKSVDASVANGKAAAEKLETLNAYIKEMNTIIELIDSITEQTSLLAINANIEAARAGDYGRGFAVVATEISQMAGQTSDATVQITQLIGDVAKAIREVVHVIYKMIDGINEEKSSTQNTVNNLSNIRSDTHAVQKNVDLLMASISDLKEANYGIIDSIQTISAISEEVTAHAAETKESEARNVAIINTIADNMQSLIE